MFDPSKSGRAQNIQRLMKATYKQGKNWITRSTTDPMKSMLLVLWNQREQCSPSVKFRLLKNEIAYLGSLQANKNPTPLRWRPERLAKKTRCCSANCFVLFSSYSLNRTSYSSWLPEFSSTTAKQPTELSKISRLLVFRLAASLIDFVIRMTPCMR